MSCLFTAGEEPLGTRGGQGWGEAKRCWGFPLISMDGWRLGRARQWYLYSGISSLMGTAVLGSVDLCMGQCIRESSKGGWANSGSPVHSVGRAMLVLLSPTPVVMMVPPQPACPSTHHPPLPQCKLPFLGFCLIQTANLRHWKAISQRKQIHGEVVSESVKGNTLAVYKVSRNS